MSEFLTKKKLLLNGIVGILARFIAMAASFVLLPVFIHELGAELYGLWIIVGVIGGQLGFLDLGLTDGLNRAIAQDIARNDYEMLSKHFWSGVMLLGILGVVAAGVFWFGESYFLEWFKVPGKYTEDARLLLRVSGFFMLLEWPLRMVGTIPAGALLQRYTAPLATGQYIVTTILSLIMLWNGFGLASLRWMYGFLSIVNALCLLGLIRWKLPDMTLRFISNPLPLIVAIFPYSIGVFYTGVISYLSTGIDTFLLGLMLSLESVTSYNIVTKFFMLSSAFIAIALSSLNMTAVHLEAEQDFSRIERLLNKAIRYRLFMTYPFVVTSVVIMPDFIRLWVGEQYVRDVIWGQIFMCVAITTSFGVAAPILKGCGHIRFLNILYTISAGTNFILTLLLIPVLGVGGAILGTVIAHLLFGDPIKYPYICRKFNWDWKPGVYMFLKSVAFNLPIFLLLILLKQFVPLNNWIAMLIASGLLFGFVSFVNIFLTLTSADREEGKNICQKYFRQLFG